VLYETLRVKKDDKDRGTGEYPESWSFSTMAHRNFVQYVGLKKPDFIYIIGF